MPGQPGLFLAASAERSGAWRYILFRWDALRERAWIEVPRTLPGDQRPRLPLVPILDLRNFDKVQSLETLVERAALLSRRPAYLRPMIRIGEPEVRVTQAA